MKKGKFSIQDCKNVSPYSFYPYIGKDNQENQIEIKKQVWINGQILSWEHNPTQVNSSA